MACTLTIGRAEQCKDSVGGLLAVYAIPFNGLSYWRGGSSLSPRDTSDNRVNVLAIKTELHGNNTLDTEIVSSRNEGTTYETQTLVLNLKGSDVELYRMLRNLSDRYYFAVQTRNLPNEYRLIGTNQNNTIDAAKVSAKGAEITQIKTVSGASMGDYVGATITITSEVSCGELNRTIGYGLATESYLTIFDPKLIDTYESWSIGTDIDAGVTSVADIYTLNDGTYFNLKTGEAVGVVDNGSTLTLTRGLLGTYDVDMKSGQILYKIA